MAKARVLVTDISGKGKKIFHHGDVVTEESFPVGKFQKLVDGKFIELVTEAPVVEVVSDDESKEMLPELNSDDNSNELDSNESTEESEDNDGGFGFNKGKKKKGKK